MHLGGEGMEGSVQSTLRDRLPPTEKQKWSGMLLQIALILTLVTSICCPPLSNYNNVYVNQDIMDLHSNCSTFDVQRTFQILSKFKGLDRELYDSR